MPVSREEVINRFGGLYMKFPKKIRKVLKKFAYRTWDSMELEDIWIPNGSEGWTKESACFFRCSEEIEACESTLFPDELYNEKVDVIIPVYNGYEYLQTLLDQVKNTSMNHRFIIINDCSPDDRIRPLLEKFIMDEIDSILINHNENLGFVKSVNEALKLSDNHVIILNTDVEVPKNWMERLIAPFVIDGKIASTTPYTNSGTICSFPTFLENNDLLSDCSVQEMDNLFNRYKPRYQKIPTGVGFCMGMNKKAITKIGYFDEVFGKGYGEENDWCCRAEKAGMKNVQVENLFVYHKHGGSFSSESKAELTKNNYQALIKKHGNYAMKVSTFIREDPNRAFRERILFDYSIIISNSIAVYFNHMAGGGAYSYLLKEKDEIVKKGGTAIVVSYHPKLSWYELTLYKDEDCYVIKQDCFDKVIDILSKIKIQEIIINELVSYQALYSKLDTIQKLAKDRKSKLTMLIHDFYCVCPTACMIQKDGICCRLALPDQNAGEDCADSCLEDNIFNRNKEYENIRLWRYNWKKFLKGCDEIRFFSNNSRDIVKNVYGEFGNESVIPHIVETLDKVENKEKKTDELTIGIIGAIGIEKGANIIKDLVDIISRSNIKARVVLIGYTSANIPKSEHYISTGKYNREQLPKLVEEHDIDIFLIPSVVPETFSYTTSEIIAMDKPIAVFNIGAPKDRVKEYSKGMIIPEISAESAWEKIISRWDSNKIKHD